MKDRKVLGWNRNWLGKHRRWKDRRQIGGNTRTWQVFLNRTLPLKASRADTLAKSKWNSGSLPLTFKITGAKTAESARGGRGRCGRRAWKAWKAQNPKEPRKTKMRKSRTVSRPTPIYIELLCMRSRNVRIYTSTSCHSARSSPHHAALYYFTELDLLSVADIFDLLYLKPRSAALHQAELLLDLLYIMLCS